MALAPLQQLLQFKLHLGSPLEYYGEVPAPRHVSRDKTAGAGAHSLARRLQSKETHSLLWEQPAPPMLVVGVHTAVSGSQKLPRPQSVPSSTLASQVSPVATALTQCPDAPKPGASQAKPSSQTETEPDGNGHAAPSGKISTTWQTFFTHSVVAAPSGLLQVAEMAQARPGSAVPFSTRHAV